MQIEQLERDILVVTGTEYFSNATVFLSDQGALLVDALASRNDAEELRRQLEQKEIAVRLFVLTHSFSDHLAALSCFPKVPIIAHARSQETHLMEQHVTDEEAAFYRAPNVLIQERLDIDWGRHHLELSHHPGHTPSALMIDVPDADLLLSGDVAVGNMAYVKYADVPALERSLDWARTRARTRVVQGHRGVSNSSCFARAQEYVSALRRWSRSDRRSDPSLETCLSPEVVGNEFEDFFHRRNVELIRHGSLEL